MNNINELLKLLDKDSIIDFGKIFKDLLKHKKKYYIVLSISFLLAAIYGLSLPNYYECEIKLSPEMSTNSKSASALTLLASRFGVNTGAARSTLNATEALFPVVYPELMNSVDFKTSLFPIIIHRDGDTRQLTYYDYLTKGQKTPWWSKSFNKLLSVFRKKSELSNDSSETINPFRLTDTQSSIYDLLNNNVDCKINKKTMMITITVTDQDPLIAAMVADSVKNRLQKFIVNYRVSKAKEDYNYNRKIYKQVKEQYNAARHEYATFVDKNRDVQAESIRQEISYLENELQIKFNLYQQVANNLQQAEMMIQEETPAFVTLQRSTVPLIKAGPHRAQTCLSWMFIAFIFLTIWILYKEKDLKMLIGF